MRRRFSVITHWGVYLGLAGYWLILNTVPWEVLYQLPGFPGTVTMMESAFPSIAGLPDEVRFGGLLHSKAQLTVIHITGTIAICLVAVEAREFDRARPIPLTSYILGSLCWLALAVFLLWFLTVWDGSASDKRPYSAIGHDSEVKMTAVYIFYWWMICGCVAFAKSIFLTGLRRMRSVDRA